MDVCIPNIGPRQRRRRLATGVISLGIALAAGTYLLMEDRHLLLRGLLFLPIYGTFLGFLQYRERT